MFLLILQLAWWNIWRTYCMICVLSFIIATEVTLFWGRMERLTERLSRGGYAPWEKACARSFACTFTRTFAALRDALYPITRAAGTGSRVAGTGSLTLILTGQRTCPCDPAKFTWGGVIFALFGTTGALGRLLRDGLCVLDALGALGRTDALNKRILERVGCNLTEKCGGWQTLTKIQRPRGYLI